MCTLPPRTLLFTVYFSGDIISSNSVSREPTCLVAAVSSWRSLASSPVCFCRERAADAAAVVEFGTFVRLELHLFSLPASLCFIRRAPSEHHGLVATTMTLPRPRAALTLAFILLLSLARSRRRVYDAARFCCRGKRSVLLARSVISFDFTVEMWNAVWVSPEGPPCWIGLDLHHSRNVE